MKNIVYLAIAVAVIAQFVVTYSIESSYSKTEIHSGEIKTTCYDKDGKVMPGNVSTSECLNYHSKLINTAPRNNAPIPRAGNSIG